MHPHISAEAARLRGRDLAGEARRAHVVASVRPARRPARPRRIAGSVLIAVGERLVGRPPDLEAGRI